MMWPMKAITTQQSTVAAQRPARQVARVTAAAAKYRTGVRSGEYRKPLRCMEDPSRGHIMRLFDALRLQDTSSYRGRKECCARFDQKYQVASSCQTQRAGSAPKSLAGSPRFHCACTAVSRSWVQR